MKLTFFYRVVSRNFLSIWKALDINVANITNTSYPLATFHIHFSLIFGNAWAFDYDTSFRNIFLLRCLNCHSRNNDNKVALNIMRGRDVTYWFTIVVERWWRLTNVNCKLQVASIRFVLFRLLSMKLHVAGSAEETWMINRIRIREVICIILLLLLLSLSLDWCLNRRKKKLGSAELGAQLTRESKYIRAWVHVISVYIQMKNLPDDERLTKKLVDFLVISDLFNEKITHTNAQVGWRASFAGFIIIKY